MTPMRLFAFVLLLLSVFTRAVFAGADDAFGQLPDLKEEHVPAAQELPRMRKHELLHDSRMRNVQNNEVAHYSG